MPAGLRLRLPRIRELRARQGITLMQLVERSGVTLSTLSRVERGLQEAWPTTAHKIAMGLGVTVAQLQGLEPMPWEQAPDKERPAA